MTHSPLVSIIVIFYNAIEYLEESIESVLAQTYKHWELLLVDDGSSDGSSELARKYASQDTSRIRYLEHEYHQNLGMSVSRNLGIWSARGDYVALLDADDIWLPEKLETHIAIFEAHPKADMLYGSSKYWFSWTGQSNDVGRDYFPKNKVKTQITFTPPALLRLFLEGKTEIPCPCSVMVRTKSIKKIGGFEEAFRGMYEDQAFYAKMCLSSTIIATGDCLAWYRQHSSSNYATAISSGNMNTLHYNFLKWLVNYCQEQNVENEKVWQALLRQLWLYDNSSHSKIPILSPNNLRWLKKWILRLEEFILPKSLRFRLWVRNLDK